MHEEAIKYLLVHSQHYFYAHLLIPCIYSKHNLTWGISLSNEVCCGYVSLLYDIEFS